MRLTKRESKLFAAMVAVLFLILYVQYLVIPLLQHQQSVARVKDEVRTQYERAKNAPAEEKRLDAEFDKYRSQARDYLSKYFSAAPQEELVLMLHEFTKPEPVLERVKFSPAASLSKEDPDFSVQAAELKTLGTYPATVKLLQSIWNFPKHMAIDSVKLERATDGLISSTVKTSFYWVPYAPDHNDAIAQWMPDQNYYKTDPFSTMEGDPNRINYIFLGGDETKLQDLFRKPFVDIAGHWAEKEIDSFRQKGYVIADAQNRFKPDEPMTRGEFIIMLDKIYQWPVPEGTVDLTKYTDYSTLGSYEGPIAKAIYKGYLGGYVIGFTDNTLRPRDPITYEEMEYVMSKIKNAPTFSWLPIATQLKAQKAVESKGATDRTAPMSRAEAVYLMTYFK